MKHSNSYEMDYTGNMIKSESRYLIVTEKRGECTVGYRVQSLARNGSHYINRGRRLFDLDSARKYRDHLIQYDQSTTQPITTEVVE